jgi:hypothetical protein
MARAMRAAGSLNPKPTRVMSRILVLADSMRALGPVRRFRVDASPCTKVSGPRCRSRARSRRPSPPVLTKRAHVRNEITAVSQVRPDAAEQLLHPSGRGADRAQPWPAQMSLTSPAPVHPGQQAGGSQRIGPRVPRREVLQDQDGALAGVLSVVTGWNPDADDRRDLPVKPHLAPEHVQSLGYRTRSGPASALHVTAHRAMV